MTRLIILAEQPDRLGRDEALEWLKDAVRAAAGQSPATAGLNMIELEDASLGWTLNFRWLLELELANGQDPEQVLAEGPWCELLSDMRLLGMRPGAAVA